VPLVPFVAEPAAGLLDDLRGPGVRETISRRWYSRERARDSRRPPSSKIYQIGVVNPVVFVLALSIHSSPGAPHIPAVREGAVYQGDPAPRTYLVPPRVRTNYLQ